ncbi:MAG TPA: hypothetical protein P5105_01925 [Victivallales bacterium]|nr:hypothetical protein [Victivallales bacterium]HRR28047.1 hypothetical protein [Victivallales bacterium]HRU01026.1 hypothetical protein [Victivallales bacterium]
MKRKIIVNKTFINILVFLSIWITSFSIRTCVFNREAHRLTKIEGIEQPPSGPFLPFNVESAMAFNYAWQIASGKINLLGPDIKLVGFEKISVNRQFNVGNEYFLGYGYRLKKFFLGEPKLSDKDKIYEDNPYFSQWARFQLRLWASLSSALIFLLLRLSGLPLFLSIFGGLLHCISPAAIARYTGQDIVGGAFAMPFLIFSYCLAIYCHKNFSYLHFISFIIFSFISLAVWDMTQVILSILCCVELIRIFVGGGSGKKRRILWYGLALAIFAVAITVPYHIEHLLILSPLVIFLLPSVLICQNVFKKNELFLNRISKITLIVLPLFFLSSIIGKYSGYTEKYGHFAKLMFAKIRFMNIKPENPALLDFDSRILWTPAMHSANINILRAYFPAALYLVFLLIVFAILLWLFFDEKFRFKFRFRSGWIFLNISFFFIYFVLFFFIVRYHVFLAVFMSLILPQISFILTEKFSVCSYRKILAFVIWTLLVFAIFAETIATISRVRKYEDYFWGEVSTLIRWFRQEGVDNKIFLADIEVSPMLLAYCNAGIVLQPKFENEINRKNFKDFVMLLFHGTERDLMKFCEKNAIDYLIYDRGLAGPMNIYSMRYFANAANLSSTCPAYLMSKTQTRKKLRYFYEIQVPDEFKIISNRYVVFKVITDDNSVNSAQWVNDGKIFLKNGNFDMARRLAKAAVYTDPNNYKARLFYAELFGEAAKIRLRGF